MTIVSLSAAMLLTATAFAADTESVPRMSTGELKSRLGEPGLLVLDVRGSWDWDSSNEKIPGSEHVNPTEVDQWAGHYPKEKTLVLYCA
jgi:rhodanese-related sulfurtransferase